MGTAINKKSFSIRVIDEQTTAIFSGDDFIGIVKPVGNGKLIIQNNQDRWYETEKCVRLHMSLVQTDISSNVIPLYETIEFHCEDEIYRASKQEIIHSGFRYEDDINTIYMPKKKMRKGSEPTLFEQGD